MNLGMETEFVAFEESLDNVENALASIAAMLNKHSWGRLYFGVAADGTVVGLDVDCAYAIAEIQAAAAASINPSATLAFERLEDAGRMYLRISFQGSDAPYSHRGRFLTRTGSANREMSNEEFFQASKQRTLPPTVQNAAQGALSSGKAPTTEYIAQLLLRTGKAEGRTGVSLLREICEQMAVPLMIDRKTGEVWARVGHPDPSAPEQAPLSLQAIPRANETPWARRPKNERAVCGYLLEHGASMTADMEDELNIPRRTLRDILKRLRDAGLVDSYGADKNRTYSLKG